MYHIFAPQCQRQDSTRLGEYHPPRAPISHARPDSVGLIEAPAAVLAGVGGVDQQVYLTGASGGLDPFGAVDDVAGTRLHPEAIEHRLAQRQRDPLAEIGGDLHIIDLEGALQDRAEFVSVIPHLDAGLRFSLTPRLGLGAGLSIGISAPAASIQFAGREVATWGRPLWLGNLMLESVLD